MQAAPALQANTQAVRAAVLEVSEDGTPRPRRVCTGPLLPRATRLPDAREDGLARREIQSSLARLSSLDPDSR